MNRKKTFVTVWKNCLIQYKYNYQIKYFNKRVFVRPRILHFVHNSLHSFAPCSVQLLWNNRMKHYKEKNIYICNVNYITIANLTTGALIKLAKLWLKIWLYLFSFCKSYLNLIINNKITWLCSIKKGKSCQVWLCMHK